MKEWFITALIFILLRVLEAAVKRWNKRAAETVQKWDDKVSRVILDIIAAIKHIFNLKRKS